MSLLSSYVGRDARWINVTTNHTARRNTKLIVDTTTQAVTVTLPTNPVDGDFVHVRPTSNQYESNTLDISSSDKNIQGSAADYTVDVNGVDVAVVFEGSDNEWKVYHTGNLANGTLSGGQFISGTAGQQSPYRFVDNTTTGNLLNLSDGDRLLIDTTNGTVTLTLPASALIGEEVVLLPVANSYATNNLTVQRNGHNLNSSASDLVISTNGRGVRLVYTNVTIGWTVFDYMTIGTV